MENTNNRYIPYFLGTEVDGLKDSIVMCSGNIKKSEIPCMTQTIYMPIALVQVLKEKTVGQTSPTIVALVEHCLESLINNNKSLILKKRK